MLNNRDEKQGRNDRANSASVYFIDRCIRREKQKAMAATEVEKYGRGGLRRVCEATGMSHNTIAHGIKEIQERRQLPPEEQSVSGQVRQKGGGTEWLVVAVLKIIVQVGVETGKGFRCLRNKPV
jgi:hypothetical protein